MAKVNWRWEMEQSIKEDLWWTTEKVRERLFILTEMSLKELGGMDLGKARELTFTNKVPKK